MILLLLGCAVTRVGLVEPADDRVWLRGLGGEVASLRLEGDAEPVRWLHGCIVEVRGPRLGRTVVVRDWRVLDAGDGSGNFVGVLRAWGGRLLIEDRNLGAVLVVDDALAGELRPWVDQPVLLFGYLSGPSTVTPVAWRLLAPEPGSKP